ncbi:hypothetical protein FRB99_003515 [Tulasnella sp. 403]|nr:hypothetical protein FRB99_003515 [Tulasnella sp. 403]
MADTSVAINRDQLLALSVFIAYFTAIIALFTTILRKIPLGPSGKHLQWKVVTPYGVLALASLAYTWYREQYKDMLAYMAWSFHNYETRTTSPLASSILLRVGNWLSETALFEEAWHLVCDDPVKWWWSEQICVFTAVWTVYVFEQARIRRIKHAWAFMLLGFMVSMAVAMNLFYLHVSLLPPLPKTDRKKGEERRKPDNGPPKLLSACVLASLITVIAMPSLITTPYFLHNLLLMHILLLVPLLLPSRDDHRPRDTSMLYAILALMAFAIRIRSTKAVFDLLNPSYNLTSLPTVSSEALGATWTILHWHPAQASIGWDVIWFTASFFIWRGSTEEAQNSYFAEEVTSAIALVGFGGPVMAGLLSKQ